MQKRSLIAISVCAIFFGCSSSSPTYGGGGGGGGTTGGGHTASIAVKNNLFSPTPDTVSAGTVTFTWNTPSNGHSVIWDSGPGTLPTNTAVMSSGTYSPTLVQGTYQYHCSIHGSPGGGMHGTIVVQ
jgi:plastocyanin